MLQGDKTMSWKPLDRHHPHKLSWRLVHGLISQAESCTVDANALLGSDILRFRVKRRQPGLLLMEWHEMEHCASHAKPTVCSGAF